MDGDPRTRGEHQLEAPAAQLAGQAVAVHQHGGRLLAALGEFDPVDLLRIEVRRPVAHLQPKGAEGARHEEAVAVAHHGAEAGVAGGGPAGPQAQLLDLLDREARRVPAGRDRDALVLEEAGHGVAVGEHDAGEPALAAAEEDARHRRPRQDERAVGGPHLEGRLLDRAAHGVGAAELRGIDVGPAAHVDLVEVEVAARVGHVDQVRAVGVPGGKELVGRRGGEAAAPAAVRIDQPDVEAAALLRKGGVGDLAPVGRPGGLILGARVVGERNRVLPVGVREPDVTRAVQLRHEEELLAVRGEARVILVLGAAGELLLARAVGADARRGRVFRRILADLGTDLYVAEDERGEIVGLVSVLYARSLARGGRSALLDGARARRPALLAELVAFAEERARKRGCRRLAAWVDAGDAELRAALLARGYHAGELLVTELAGAS